MTLLPQPPESRSNQARLPAAISTLAVVLLAATFTVGAVGAFPIWDDGWLWLLLEEQGTDAIVPSHPERPVVTHIWLALAPTVEVFWRNAFIAQALLWPILALLSARLWKRLFPQLGSLAGGVALVSIAPFVMKVQMVTANVALTSLLTVVLAYCGVLLAMRFAAAADARGWAALALGMALMAFAVLIQEYAVPVALAGAVLIGTNWQRSQGGRALLRHLGAAVGLLATAGVSYLAYLRLASFESATARDALNPTSFRDLSSFVAEAPEILATAVWNGLLGGLLNSVSGALPELKRAPWLLVGGVLIAVALAWGSRSISRRESPVPRASVFAGVRLMLALAVALAPAVIGDQTPWDPADGMASRFGLPAMPVLGALVVLLVAGYLPARHRWIPLAVLGLAAGTVAAAEASTAHRERELLARMGHCMQPRVDANDQKTVAVVLLPPRSLGPRRQWELTARLAFEYPSGLSRRVWAHRFHGDAVRSFGRRVRCRGKQSVHHTVRNLKRRGILQELLWLEELEDGGIVMETYCRPGMAEPALRILCAPIE